jgi:hypothetical protein
MPTKNLNLNEVEKIQLTNLLNQKGVTFEDIQIWVEFQGYLWGLRDSRLAEEKEVIITTLKELIRKFLEDNKITIREADNYDGEDKYAGTKYYFVKDGEEIPIDELI